MLLLQKYTFLVQRRFINYVFYLMGGATNRACYCLHMVHRKLGHSEKLYFWQWKYLQCIYVPMYDQHSYNFYEKECQLNCTTCLKIWNYGYQTSSSSNLLQHTAILGWDSPVHTEWYVNQFVSLLTIGLKYDGPPVTQFFENPSLFKLVLTHVRSVWIFYSNIA